MIVWQLLFLVVSFTGDESAIVTATRGVHLHFFLFHMLLLAFLLLESGKHYVWGEVAICANFVNILYLYLRLPAPSVKGLWSIHIPVVRLPLALLALMVLHYGSVMVHCHGFACRLLANIFVWELLVFGGLLLLVFGDWATGFALSYVTLSLAIGQLFTKVIALQWIFGFVIAGLLFVLSVGTLVSPRLAPAQTQESGEEERAPLLQ